MTLTDDMMARAAQWGRKDGNRMAYPLITAARGENNPAIVHLWDEDGDYMGEYTAQELAQMIIDCHLSPIPFYKS